MSRPRTARRAAATAAAVAALILAPLAAFATFGSAVANGDFETGSPAALDPDYDDEFWDVHGGEDGLGDETDDLPYLPVAGSVVPHWTVVDGQVDLGVTEIAGCTTVDTSDYSELRGWDDDRYPYWPVDWTAGYTYTDTDSNAWQVFPVVDADGNPVPEIAGMDLVFVPEESDYRLINEGAGYLEYADYYDDAAWAAAVAAYAPASGSAHGDDLVDAEHYYDPSEGTPAFRAGLVDGAGLYAYVTDDDEIIDFYRDSQVLVVASDMDATWRRGYVAHGPAVYSEPFTVPEGRQINLTWAASGATDDFHVFGYLLNIDTCAQTEVIDATGEAQPWTTTGAVIPAAGTYRFVFVGGGYDQNAGGGSGSLLYVDDIVQTTAVSGTAVDLSLDVATGSSVQGAPVAIVGGGLQSGSAYSVVLGPGSTTVRSGVADLAGAFAETFALPSDIAPGAHTLTLYGVAPDGSQLTKVVYFTVGADGTLTYLSYVGPQAALPVTGVDGKLLTAAAGALVALGAAGLLIARRRAA